MRMLTDDADDVANAIGAHFGAWLGGDEERNKKVSEKMLKE